MFRWCLAQLFGWCLIRPEWWGAHERALRFYVVLPFLAVEMMSRLTLRLKMNIIINYGV